MSLSHSLVGNELLQIGVTIVIAGILLVMSRTFIERLVRRIVPPDRFETKLDERKREDTLINVLGRLFAGLIWIVGILVILTVLHVNLAAFLTGAGLIGIVVGFGAQNTVKDYLAGVYIVAENQYRVGDIVTLSGGTTSALGVSGMVEEISLRITKLRDLDGTLNIVRNGDAGIVTNRTSKYSSIVMNIFVDYTSHLETVKRVIDEVGRSMLEDDNWKQRIIEPVSFFRVEDFSETGVRVQCVGKVKPAEQWDVASEFRLRLKPAFDEAKLRFGVPERAIRTIK